MAGCGGRHCVLTCESPCVVSGAGVIEGSLGGPIFPYPGAVIDDRWMNTGVLPTPDNFWVYIGDLPPLTVAEFNTALDVHGSVGWINATILSPNPTPGAVRGQQEIDLPSVGGPDFDLQFQFCYRGHAVGAPVTTTIEHRDSGVYSLIGISQYDLTDSTWYDYVTEECILRLEVAGNLTIIVDLMAGTMDLNVGGDYWTLAWPGKPGASQVLRVAVHDHRVVVAHSSDIGPVDVEFKGDGVTGNILFDQVITPPYWDWWPHFSVEARASGMLNTHGWGTDWGLEATLLLMDVRDEDEGGQHQATKGTGYAGGQKVELK